jgi:hypothetical protein
MCQIRRNQKVTTIYSTEAVELNPEKFKSISIPFLGEDEDDFVEYIQDNISVLEDIIDELDAETSSELYKLIDATWSETYNSSWDGEESWTESGEVINDRGFEVNHTTEY